MKVGLVGVVGAGVMGRGVAQALAQSRHRVVLLDNRQGALDDARAELIGQIRFAGLFRKGAPGPGAGPAPTPSEDSQRVLERISFGTDLELLRDADFVIENVPERFAVKEAVYRRLDGLCPARCIFASNTSAIPITRIASATRRPAKVIGTHFMNPVPLKGTVEVIRGEKTSDETLRATIDLLSAMGKESIVVRDSPGFVSNRVLMLTINEAIFLVQDGVASVEDVDRLFRQCFGHKMGPLETADLIGLDTILASIEVLRESFGDDKYRPCPLLQEMVESGRLGRKSGQGFYPHSPPARARP